MNSQEKLEKLQKKTDTSIFTVSSIFPFELFPDIIQVDREKISLIRNRFFLTRKVFPILLKDIKTVRFTTGPVFGTLQFEIEGYEANPQPLKHLKRLDAIKAKRIIEGLIILKEKNIDTSKLSDQQLVNKAIQFGKEHQRKN